LKGPAPRGVPPYWARAKRQLAERDPVMKSLIRRHPGVALVGRGEAFSTLARSIVGQQISVKAADRIWVRFIEAVGEVTPPGVLKAGERNLAGAGLSRRKVEYLLDLARHVESRKLRPAAWAAMDDDAVIAELTRVRGIGRWTAEMFLIFTLLRPDVLPVDDLGLLRAAGIHYLEGRVPAKAELLELARPWQPWRTVATWYLWRSLDPVPVEY